MNELICRRPVGGSDTARDVSGCAGGGGGIRRRAGTAALLLTGAALLLPAAVAAQSRTVFGTNYSGTTGFSFTLGGVAGNNAVVSNATCEVGAPYGGGMAPTGTNYPGAFYTPAPTPGVTPGIAVNINRDGAVAGCATVVPSFRTTLTFAQAFDSGAVRMHYLNSDAGQYEFAPTAGLSIVRLSGNNEFEVTGTLVNSTARTANVGGCEANDGSNPEGACGTIRLDAAAGSLGQVIWDNIDIVNSAGSGDGHVLMFSLTQPSLQIRKRTTGATGSNSFTFSYPSNVQSDAAAPTAATGETIAVATDNTFVDGLVRYIANSAQDTTLSEAVPAGWTLSDASCIDLANGNAVVATLAAPVTGPATASLTLAAADVGPDAQIRCDFTNAKADPRLDIVKTASAGSFVVGVPASYTLQVTNGGTGATTAAATVTDAIPAALTPGTAPAGCTIAGQDASCTIPAGLAAGASVSFVIPVTPTPAADGTTVTNTALVSGGGDTTCPTAAHCSSSTTTPVGAPQLSLAKTASTAGFVVGVPASYTLTVANTGSAATTEITTVTDPVPATLAVGTPLPAGCTAAGQVVTCTIAAGLAPGAQAAFTIPVTPNLTAADTAVVNTATLSGNGCGSGSGCSSAVTTPVAPSPQQRPVPALGPAGVVGLGGLLALVALVAQRRRPLRRY
ncbi:DUF11 domain-containing protein [Tahibacter harae]|uniref:DUF11 domain-containing protein n=1 Tax=Tahibacter harae TaxID=2963937 RepID=A0ABT1QLU6_9GAMM|nr:DUF11 domain-containing protein [Tahibacter harae]MCQ4163402.1 DUF11 domain-containing protein [Tahibacter harae]